MKGNFRLFVITFIGLQLIFFSCKLFFVYCNETLFDTLLIAKMLILGLKYDVGILFFVLSFLYLWVLVGVSNNKIIAIVLTSCSMIFALIAISDILLYIHWGTIFSIRAAQYLTNPIELIKNIDTHSLLIITISIGILGILFYKLYYRLIKEVAFDTMTKKEKPRIIIAIIFFGILGFYFVRGGFREIPLNQSDAYFCNRKVYNLATINATWNFFNIMINNKKFIKTNPYQKMNPIYARKIVQREYQTGRPYSIQMFDVSHTKHPNIILISMEGINAELFKIHNGHHANMPFLESLIDSSYYFTKCYSVGFRTEQGIAALLSGAISSPHSNITDNVSILDQLPSIVSNFIQLHYTTKFWFGGNIEFANMKAYLLQIGFDRIIEILDFDRSLRTQKLGVNDANLFQKVSMELPTQSQPFFYQIMTQSTHEPYDIAMNQSIVDEETKYINSAHYLDSCLSIFISKYKETPAYQNSIIIITSDHAHRFPGNIDIASDRRYHIPMLVYSPLLHHEMIGKKDTVLMSQADFPATLSHLLHWPSTNYLSYSKNHFSTAKKFTFSTFVEGYVYLTDTNRYAIEYIWGDIDYKNKKMVQHHVVPMAIMQDLVDKIRKATLHIP